MKINKLYVGEIVKIIDVKTINKTYGDYILDFSSRPIKKTILYRFNSKYMIDLDDFVLYQIGVTSKSKVGHLCIYPDNCHLLPIDEGTKKTSISLSSVLKLKKDIIKNC